MTLLSRQRLNVLAAACALGAALAAGSVQAQDYRPGQGDIALRVGAAGVLFNSGGTFTLGGAPLAGAALELSDNTTVAIEADYYVRRNISLSLTLGIPPETDADGRGSIAALGRLGSVRYGPGVALAKYHFSGLGQVQPWVGAGVTRMEIFSETDGAVTNLKVKPAWGGAVQVGADYMFNERFGAYASVSHLFLETKGQGTFAALPVTAKIDMNPMVIQAGLTFRR